MAPDDLRSPSSVRRVLRPRLPRHPREWVLIVSTGVLLLGVNYALLYWGLQFISSGLTAVLQATVPLFGLLFAHRLLPDERITPLRLGAMVLGIAGVAVIFAHQIEFAGRAAFFGSIAVVGGAVCVALAYVVIKAYGNHLHPSVRPRGRMRPPVPMTLSTLCRGQSGRRHWRGGRRLGLSGTRRIGLAAGGLLAAETRVRPRCS